MKKLISFSCSHLMLQWLWLRFLSTNWLEQTIIYILKNSQRFQIWRHSTCSTWYCIDKYYTHSARPVYCFFLQATSKVQLVIIIIYLTQIIVQEIPIKISLVTTGTGQSCVELRELSTWLTFIPVLFLPRVYDGRLVDSYDGKVAIVSVSGARLQFSITNDVRCIKTTSNYHNFLPTCIFFFRSE